MSPKLHLSGCLACSLSDIPACLWTQMEIHLLPAPSWLLFLFYSHPHPHPSQELVCQQKSCTSLRAYQTVYPFPVGAVHHLWLSQTIATPRVHSKSWFRCMASPVLLYKPSLSHFLFSLIEGFLIFTFSQSITCKWNPCRKQTGIFFSFSFSSPLNTPFNGQNSPYFLQCFGCATNKSLSICKHPPWCVFTHGETVTASRAFLEKKTQHSRTGGLGGDCLQSICHKWFLIFNSSTRLSGSTLSPTKLQICQKAKTAEQSKSRYCEF